MIFKTVINVLNLTHFNLIQTGIQITAFLSPFDTNGLVKNITLNKKNMTRHIIDVTMFWKLHEI